MRPALSKRRANKVRKFAQANPDDIVCLLPDGTLSVAIPVASGTLSPELARIPGAKP
jgi:hypothetical protein